MVRLSPVFRIPIELRQQILIPRPRSSWRPIARRKRSHRGFLLSPGPLREAPFFGRMVIDPQGAVEVFFVGRLKDQLSGPGIPNAVLVELPSAELGDSPHGDVMPIVAGI